MIGPSVVRAVDKGLLIGDEHAQTHGRRSMGTIASETL